GQITSWSWDFDDGTTSTEEHPLHRYEKAGEYVVVLTINGPQGTARRVKVNEVVVR
ncbi:MAG: PKD domain-containing protein, partial [Gemmatimonadetes bacterium]|nr:PKD domain-containing protein [Gemmatimonadota bacterium]